MTVMQEPQEPRKSAIKYIHRNGSQAWSVVLECGHRITILKAEMARLQWFIGRPVNCTECSKEETHVAPSLDPRARHSA